MWKKVLLVLAALVAILLATIASRPGGYEVERTATVAAPPAVVYAQVSDFSRWAEWSPWAKLDPSMKTTLTGTPASVGHAYAWAGNDKVGEGRMTITEATPSTRVAIRLEFLAPWKATNPTSFTFVPDGAGTRVNWKMAATNNFAMKAVSLFMDFEKMIGGDFDRGLAQLKAVSEAAARTAAAPVPAR